MRDVQRAPGARRARTRGFVSVLGTACIRAVLRPVLRKAHLWCVLLALPALACSSALRGYDVAPNGLDRNDDQLRRIMASGAADSALRQLQPSKRSIAPTDPVLRLLYQGTVAYYAGDYQTSVSSFDSAAWLADDRTVASVSREAAALLSNERALPYEPDRTERLFNAYYAALGYLRMNDRDDAAVEARRISYILENDDEGVDTREAPLLGILRYLSGVLYEAAGERTDADVAYRNATALLPALTSPSPLTGDSGDVVLLIEDGYVAHRVQHSLTLVLADDEHDRLYARDRQLRAQAADDVAARVLLSAFDTLNTYRVGPRTGRRDWFVGPPPRPRSERTTSGRYPDARCRDRARITTPSDSSGRRKDPSATTDTDSSERRKHPFGRTDTDSSGTTQPPSGSVSKAASAANADSMTRVRKKDCDDDDRTHILRMAWPSYHAERQPTLSARILYGDSIEVAAPVFASVNDAIIAQYERDRPAMLARLITRTAAKYALVKGAENAAGEGNESLGRILGTIANVSTAVLEQADTRSWTLLPGAVGIARIRLPAGTHELRVAVGSRTVRLSGMQVEAGRLRAEAVRVWKTDRD